MASYSPKIPFCRLLFFLLLCTPAIAWGQWVFPVIPGFQPNSAASLGSDCFSITPGSGTLGVVWNSTQLDLTQPFDITLSVNQQPWGADGIALVLQRSGLGAFGAGGNALGFANSLPPTPGYPPIVPSIAFELDTWDNTAAGALELPSDHLAIHRNGDLTTTIGAPVDADPAGFDVTGAACHQLRVRWTPGSNTIRLYFDGLLRLTVNYDMVGLTFGGNPLVWWGITGSSGGAGMAQTVCVGADFAQVGADRAVCAGDTLHLLATGGVSYSWQPGPPVLSNTGIANPIFGPAAPGSYTVSAEATNMLGCTDRDTTVITVEAVPVPNTGGPFSLCMGDSVQLGGPSVPGYVYLWTPNTALDDPGSAQPWALPAAAGATAYDLIVVDTSSISACRDTATVVVIAADTPTVAPMAVNDTLCQGATAFLSANATGGNGGYTYAWSNAITTATQSVSPMATTTYGITVTDGNACSSSATLAVVVNDTPLVTAMAMPGIICAGQAAQLSANASGTLPLSYLWPSGTTASTDSVAPLASTVYAVTVTDLLGCQGTANVLVTVSLPDSIDIVSVDTSVCLGGSVAVLNTFGTPGINSWTWTPPSGVSNTAAPNPVITPLTSTTYYLQGTNTSTGCGYRDSILIAYVPLGAPTLSLGGDTALCAGTSLVLDAGNPGFSYLWLGGATTQQVPTSLAGWYGVTVFDTLGCGYIATDSLLLQLNALPRPDLGNDTLICQGDSLLLADNAMTGAMLWSNGSVAPSISVLAAGAYWLRVTDSIGCSGTDTLQLQVRPLPVVTFGTLQAVYCWSDSGSLLAGSPAGGSFSGAVSALGLVDPQVAGVGSHAVTYSYQDSIGCENTTTQSYVVVAPPSAASAGSDQFGEGPFTLQATLPMSGAGSWSAPGFTGNLSDSLNPQATAYHDMAGTYLFIWTVSEPPCPANQDSMYLTFEGIHIPTGFSPNGDGVNDAFVIRGLGGYDSPKMWVFNRWGQMVWASQNYQNDWTGQNTNAEQLVDDTYYAVIEYGGKTANTYIVLKRN